MPPHENSSLFGTKINKCHILNDFVLSVLFLTADVENSNYKLGLNCNIIMLIIILSIISIFMGRSELVSVSNASKIPSFLSDLSTRIFLDFWKTWVSYYFNKSSRSGRWVRKRQSHLSKNTASCSSSYSVAFSLMSERQ